MTSFVNYDPRANGPRTFTAAEQTRGETVPALASANGATRPLHIIAREIEREWRSGDGISAVNYAARPYLNAMKSLDTMAGEYGTDSAYSVVAYFMSNAATWRGDAARRIKAELNAMMKAHNKTRGR